MKTTSNKAYLNKVYLKNCKFHIIRYWKGICKRIIIYSYITQNSEHVRTNGKTINGFRKVVNCINIQKLIKHLIIRKYNGIKISFTIAVLLLLI